MTEIAAAIARPAPGQLPLLLEHGWLTFEHPVTTLLDGTAFLFTSGEAAEDFLAGLHRHPDLGDGWYEARVVPNVTPAYDEARLRGPETGHALFARLAALPELRLIRIDSRYWVLGSFAKSAVAGRDLRPGATVLRARSIAEIRLYLDFQGAGEVEHELVYLAGELVARYGDFYFYPVTEPLELGPDPTEILCAGMLAWHVRFKGDHAAEFPADVIERWRMWADEALKLVDPATDAIPPGRVRTPYAASWLLSQHPDLLHGGPLREARARLWEV